MWLASNEQLCTCNGNVYGRSQSGAGMSTDVPAPDCHVCVLDFHESTSAGHRVDKTRRVIIINRTVCLFCGDRLFLKLTVF